jgi:hypothetical protein
MTLSSTYVIMRVLVAGRSSALYQNIFHKTYSPHSQGRTDGCGEI